MLRLHPAPYHTPAVRLGQFYELNSVPHYLILAMKFAVREVEHLLTRGFLWVLFGECPVV